MISPNQVSTGFHRAPVCKFLLGSVVGSSFLLHFPLKQYQPVFTYTQADVFDKFQIWKVFTSKLAYLDFKDVFICSVLLYYFRVFERRLGSRKFCSYLIGTGSLAICLELLAVYLCRTWEIPLDPLPSGPLCFIYPLFVSYYCDIPRVPLSYVFGIPMTGKSVSYILGLQAASSSPESILVAVCGLLAGILWRFNFLKLQAIVKVPTFLARLLDNTLGRLLGKIPAVEENMERLGATLEIQRQEVIERLEQQQIWRTIQTNQQMFNGHIGRQQPQNLVNGPGLFGAGNNNGVDGLRHRLNAGAGVDEGPAEISEDQVQLLVEMGFEHDQVRHALQMTNNDVSMATNFLLQQT